LSYLGLAALDVLLLGAGVGLLAGFGLVRSGRDAVRHAGLALVVGWAAVGIVESTALVLGAPIAWWDVTLFCLALAVAGVALTRRVPARRLGVVAERGPAAWLAVAGAAIVFVELAALLRRAVNEGAPLQWDAWAFWLPKAKSLVDFGGLDTGIGGFTSFANPGYPPFVPALDASAFAFMGNTHASPLAVQEWVIALAFFAALASLLATRVRPAILWPCLAFLAVLPTFTALIGSSLGDEPLMFLLGLGAACVALWLLEREPRYAVLAGVFLAAAAVAKNEGLPPALVLAGTALVASWRRPLTPALVFLSPLAALVPWKLWLHAHHIRSSPDYRLSDALHPSVLGDKIDRLSTAARVLPGHVFSPSQWLLAVPLMLAAAVLAAPRRPALAVLAVLAPAAVIAGLLVAYWIGFPPLDWYIKTSADRVIASGVVMSVVFLPLLLAEASSG
jgi:hypothetical protein